MKLSLYLRYNGVHEDMEQLGGTADKLRPRKTIRTSYVAEQRVQVTEKPDTAAWFALVEDPIDRFDEELNAFLDRATASGIDALFVNEAADASIHLTIEHQDPLTRSETGCSLEPKTMARLASLQIAFEVVSDCWGDDEKDPDESN